MKKILSLLLCLCFIGIMPAMAETEKGKVETQVPAVVKKITIPSGLIIPVVFQSPINSDMLQKDDLVSISVNQDVVLDGKVLFKSGTSGIAYIADLKRSGHHGRPGFLSIREARIKDVVGNDHKIQLSVESKGEAHRPSAIFLSVIGVMLIFIPFGIWRTGETARVSSARVYQGLISSPAEIIFE